MSELVERYVHQVGRYLPPQERADIEAELRSQIQDQLDDRYPEAPTQEQVAVVLAEMGYPYVIAASYSGDQYLVGPTLYPYLMLVLRRVWLIVPAIVVFLSVFAALTATTQRPFFDILVETVLAILQATLSITAIVVLFFAILERTLREQKDEANAFNPLELPKVDDPGVLDRFEVISGIVIGAIAVLVFIYFLRVGGLTLRFDLNDPGEVIASPAAWMLALIVIAAGQIVMHLLVLRQKRWGVGTWLAQTVLEIAGTIPFYFAVTRPLADHLLAGNPVLANVIFVARGPEIFVVIYAVITLINRGTTLVRLWGYREGGLPPF
jgi:hypothetical protein